MLKPRTAISLNRGRTSRKKRVFSFPLHFPGNRPDFCYRSVAFFLPLFLSAIDNSGVLRQPQRVATMSRRNDRLWLADEMFPIRLRLARTQQGWSQKKLSEMCGKRPSWRTISDWERGIVREPHLTELSRVASVLREDVLWLLRGEENVRGISARDS